MNNEELIARLNALEQRVKALEAELAQVKKVAENPDPRLFSQNAFFGR